MAKRKNSGVVDRAPAAWNARLAAWMERRSLALAAAAILIGTLRIVATYAVFNHTVDEPAHIGCGMEWLSKGTYQLETQHPPLARVFSALGPFLAGERSQGRTDAYQEGAAILYHDLEYQRNLTLARVGSLPFFWLACVVVYLAGARWYGKGTAALAVILFTWLPPILAHASLATTDMALTATFGLALYTALVWAEAPAVARGAAMGLGCALAVLAKFSSLLFIPACLGALLAWAVVSERGWTPLRPLASARHGVSLLAALGVGIVTVWAGYRFSFRGGVPAPELFAGLRYVYRHQTSGHVSYLLGARSNSGFWFFYPVALAVKTPLAFLGLLAGGMALAWRRRRQLVWAAPLAFTAATLAVGLYSRINIGTRHLLPIYFGFAMLAAAAAWDWLGRATERKWGPWLAAGLLAWLAVSGAVNHPDYLAYFNELAGSQPERILADSDLDWGQDMLRLSARLRELRAPRVTFTPLLSAYLRDYHGFPPIQPSDPAMPAPGWNAVSITAWKVMRLGLTFDHPEIVVWPDRVKNAAGRVGRGVLLYYFPPSEFR
jgi:4-amino-4-deoxy-L-arabinose transferase-like glycosyltransferase